MADHVTKQVIDAIAAAIVAGSTSAGAHVYTGRVTPIPPGDLPAVTVNGGDEQLEQMTARNPHQQRREPTIEIAAHVRSLDDYDEDAYTLLKQLEHVIAANPTVGGKARHLRATEVRWERSGEGDQPIVRTVLVCVADVFVMNNAVDVPLT